jgi:hypothetical protein
MTLFPRAVTARLVERFIFNFRLHPDEFAAHLPVRWLQPQVLNGWSVASFCILKLEEVIIWPFPGFLGFKTISCAYRCGVIDVSDHGSEPSVYITDRNTNVPIIARLAPWWFSDTIPMVRPKITHTDDSSTIQINYLDRQRLFYAEAKNARNPSNLNSEVFDSIDSFSRFIHAGISSYTPSIYGDSLAKVDLIKEDPSYMPLDATIDFSWLDGAWSDAKLIFDSAVRATGGDYKWTYRGLKSEL